jgi:hypothetical protein
VDAPSRRLKELRHVELIYRRVVNAGRQPVAQISHPTSGLSVEDWRAEPRMLHPGSSSVLRRRANRWAAESSPASSQKQVDKPMFSFHLQ